MERTTRTRRPRTGRPELNTEGANTPTTPPEPTRRTRAGTRPGRVRPPIVDGSPLDNQGPGLLLVRVNAVADARTQAGSPDVNYETGHLWVGLPDSKTVFLQFDLDAFSPDATIRSAWLELSFTGTYEGSNDVEVGAVKEAWDAGTITWENQPAVAWKGETRTVSEAGDVSWNVLPAVRAWISGERPNHGLALRGLGSVLKAAHSVETAGGSEAPRLILVVVPARGGFPVAR